MKTIKVLNWDSLTPGQNVNLGPLKHKAETSSTDHNVNVCVSNFSILRIWNDIYVQMIS
jgi:hypothetical protein